MKLSSSLNTIKVFSNEIGCTIIGDGWSDGWHITLTNSLFIALMELLSLDILMPLLLWLMLNFFAICFLKLLIWLVLKMLHILLPIMRPFLKLMVSYWMRNMEIFVGVHPLLIIWIWYCKVFLKCLMLLILLSVDLKWVSFYLITNGHWCGYGKDIDGWKC